MDVRPMDMAGWLQHHTTKWENALYCVLTWDRKELDTTERLNWTESNWNYGLNDHYYQYFIHLSDYFQTVYPEFWFKKIGIMFPKGNQSWIFIGRTDANAETPILWPPDAKSWLTGKYPDAGKEWRQEEKGTTEDKMVGWHHRLLDKSLSKLQELVMDREAWDAAVHWFAKKSNMTDQLNWTELNWSSYFAIPPSWK